MNEEKKSKEPKEESKKMTIMTELDSYISETMIGQPDKVPEIKVERERYGLHRLSLPEPFEKYSYECTRGLKCKQHRWAYVLEEIGENKKGQKIKIEKWDYKKEGKYTFRWIQKNKRSIDYARSVTGWLFANQSYFPDIPKIYFSLNGGVEIGDSILAFMFHESAMQIRNRPGEISREKLDHELNKHEDNERFYKAKLDPERSEGDDFAPAGALQEGRDF